MLIAATGLAASSVSMIHSLPASAQSTSTGTGHRTLVDANSYPWSAIGRVNISGVSTRSHCTGALIGERVVLTAAHCLYYQPTQRYVSPGLIHFVAGYQRGEFLAHSTAAQIFPAPGFDGIKWAHPSNMEHDWALLILNEPIGRQVGFLGHQVLDPETLKRLTANQEFFYLAGYPGDRAHAISLDEHCNIVGFLGQGELLSHSCRIVGGDSGAPIAIPTENGLQVVGLNSATGVALTDGSTTNTAVPIRTILQLVERAIRHTEADPVFSGPTGRHGQPPG